MFRLFYRFMSIRPPTLLLLFLSDRQRSEQCYTFVVDRGAALSRRFHTLTNPIAFDPENRVDGHE
jgi:hypothetical protein